MTHVRLSRDERQAIFDTLTEVLKGNIPRRIPRVALESVLLKLERWEMVKVKPRNPGIGWRAALAAMRVGAGPTLYAPRNPSVGWIVKINTRVRDIGLTEADCIRIGRWIRTRNAVMTFEVAVWRADTILAELERYGDGVPAGPLEMEDI